MHMMFLISHDVIVLGKNNQISIIIANILLNPRHSAKYKTSNVLFNTSTLRDKEHYHSRITAGEGYIVPQLTQAECDPRLLKPLCS